MRNTKEYTTKVILDTGGQRLSDQMYVGSFMTGYNCKRNIAKGTTDPGVDCFEQ